MARKPVIVRTLSPLRKAIVALAQEARQHRADSRPWARCMTGIFHWFGTLRSAPARLSCRSSSIRRNSRRPRISVPIRAISNATSRRWRNSASIWSGLPTDTAMYPDGFSTAIAPSGPAKAGLEDTFRPHFFGGVATVVAKLFLQVTPDFAMFGQKDYQQLKVVTRMARDLDLPVKVVGCATAAGQGRPRPVLAQCLPLARANGRPRRCFIAC